MGRAKQQVQTCFSMQAVMNIAGNMQVFVETMEKELNVNIGQIPARCYEFPWSVVLLAMLSFYDICLFLLPGPVSASLFYHFCCFVSCQCALLSLPLPWFFSHFQLHSCKLTVWFDMLPVSTGSDYGLSFCDAVPLFLDLCRGLS